MELEKSKTAEECSLQKKIISEAIEKATPTFAPIANKAPKEQPIKIPPKIQHLAVIRPVNVQNTPANTKSFVQKNVDISRIKIGVKKVSNIKNGGILIEPVESDLQKLLKELDSNKDLKQEYKMGKPSKRNPQFICYGVDEETKEDTVVSCLKNQCPQAEETEGSIKVVHSFKGPRGTNWVLSFLCKK
ncbi:hypothetical protein CDAR_276481 [Caerostris darwini]|uniref:Uncharacterized protein n=1 Tax=Caerostris darwini TaxID=1538125 RepID=A0AAV4MXT4_9ARAC|nr:hypothetical protein CDAR_276481 [Caerostris darwini]